MEAAALEPFSPQDKSGAIPEQHSGDVAAAVEKDEQMTAERVELKRGLHVQTQRVEPLSSVDRSRCDEVRMLRKDCAANRKWARVCILVEVIDLERMSSVSIVAERIQQALGHGPVPGRIGNKPVCRIHR